MAPHAGARPERSQYACHKPPWRSIIHSVNCAVEPEPSERTTGTIGRAGSVRPGLSAANRSSFHCVISPVKIRATFSPDSRRLVTCWPLIFRLYMNEVPPAVTGM